MNNNKVLVDQEKIVKDRLTIGDIKTFELVFKEYHQPLVVYANTILKNSEESQDVVQQVFITLWNKRETTEFHTSIRGFLYRAVYNACLNKIKQQAVRTNYAKEMKWSNNVMTTTDIIHEKELQQKIDEAIGQLPEQCAKIFKMSRFDNLKYQEIADTMALSIKTVENQMGKALKIMREKLKPYLPLLFVFYTY